MSSNAQVLARGETFYGPTKTCPTTYGADSIAAEGKEVEFKDDETQQTVYGRIMRNVSGATLYGGKAVVCAAAYHKKRFDGYTRLTATRADGVIDPALATVGVRTGDLCIVFYKGPCEMKLEETGEVIAVGDYAIAATAATSQSTVAAGKVLLQAGAHTAPYAHRLGIFAEAATSAHGTAGSMRRVDLNIA